jgi:hypothetical protein
MERQGDGGGRGRYVEGQAPGEGVILHGDPFIAQDRWSRAGQLS